MTYPNPEAMRAARAHDRLLSIRTEGWHEAEACDRHFDGGEWSDPAWGRSWEEAEEKCLVEIANRFGLNQDDVLDAVQYRENVGFDLWYKAYRKHEVEDSPHDAMCHEYWDRGLNCPHIPEEEREWLRRLLESGEEIPPDWGQF